VATGGRAKKGQPKKETSLCDYVSLLFTTLQQLRATRDETTQDMLVSGDLAGTGGGVVLRIDPESWGRIAEAAG
jgi:hypothetical protein